MNLKVSIIIRTFNEERWISRCLDSIQEQNYKNFEIIIVDNFSTDRTIDKVKKYKVKKIIKIKEFFPGKAINDGIKVSSGELIVCLSAHCIPKDNLWLKNFVEEIMSNKKFAAVYGRQEPMIFSSSSDKRDLLITFGLDRKIQIRDSFFHNANSIFKKEIWKQISFDEKTKNIEDRLWAQKIISKGYNIVYTPKSSVYHYHGIHQDNNKKRLNNVVKIIESNLKNYSPGRVDIKKLLIAAVIPTKGELQKYENKFKLEFTLQVIKKSNFIKKIFVSTDINKNAKVIKQLGAIPIIRNKIYSSKNINIEQVQKYVLNQIDKKFDLDLFFHFEETFPFRDYRMLDKMINVIVDQGFDSVIVAKRDPGWLWMEKSNKDLLRIDEGDKPREEKNCTYIGLKGVGLVTYPEFIRKGNLLGNKIGMFEIYNQISQIEVRNYDDYKFFYKYLKNYYKK